MKYIGNGSAKQIAWAEKIRDRIVGEVRKAAGIREYGIAHGRKTEQNTHELEIIRKIISGLENETDAKWWIDFNYQFGDGNRMVSSFIRKIDDDSFETNHPCIMPVDRFLFAAYTAAV